jgi:hypothetical protein
MASRTSDRLCCEVSFRLEGEEFKLPENEIVVDIEARQVRPHSAEIVGSAVPSYLNTCYDEFSRDFCCYSVAEASHSTVPLTDYREQLTLAGPSSAVQFPEEVDDKSNPAIQSSHSAHDARRFMQHYHPSYPGWTSTFKHTPPDTRNLLASGLKAFPTDSHILIEVTPGFGRNREFEPVFWSMALYTFVNDECCRLSETFHFSGTSMQIKHKYRDVYRFSEDDLPEYDRKCIPVNTTPAGHCLFIIPEELRRKDVFLVVQLSKVLTSEPDKAIIPYTRPNATPAIVKHVEVCKRLYSYRQPLGLGVVRILDEGGRVARRHAPLRISVYAMKQTLGEPALGQVSRHYAVAIYNIQY